MWLISEGIGVGILTGLVGVGGGFAIVPALVLLAKIPMKQSIGTSLLVIVLNSSAGFLGYLCAVAINWQLTFSFMFAASLGIFLGAYLVKFVQARHLQKAFAYFLLVMSGFMLWQNRAAFSPSQASRQTPDPNIQVSSKLTGTETQFNNPHQSKSINQ